MPRIFKRSCDQCGNEYEGEGKRYCSQACANIAKVKFVPPQVSPAIGELLPVRPVEVNIPVYDLPSVQSGRAYTSLHYGDVHYPFQDDAAVRVLYAITKDLQPDLVVCHGDLLDCYKISRFQKNPHHRVTLQREIELAAEHLGTMAGLAPNAEKRLYKGNHEDRVRRLVWEMAQSDASAQLLTLPGVAASLELPTLLGLKALGWDWYESRSTLFEKMILKHGDVVRKHSAMTAKGEWEKYGTSGISGHTHRMGSFFHRDQNGSQGWWEHGCLCNLEPDYCPDPDWQNGLCVVSWSEDRTRFAVEPVFIHEGEAYFRGQRYAA